MEKEDADFLTCFLGSSLLCWVKFTLKIRNVCLILCKKQPEFLLFIFCVIIEEKILFVFPHICFMFASFVDGFMD